MLSSSSHRILQLLHHLGVHPTSSRSFSQKDDSTPSADSFLQPPWPYTSVAPPPGYFLSPVSESPTVPKLFQPLSIRGLTLKNRIVVSPMCQYTSMNGFLNDWHLVHLGSFATSGAALVFQEATAVSPEGRISPNDAGIYLPEHVHMLKRIAAFIHSQKCTFGIQLAHAGRKASTPISWHKTAEDKHNATYIPQSEGGWPDSVLGASPIPWDAGWLTPKQMSVADIKSSVQDWVIATERCIEVGYDVIEIHGAHGYLFSSFLSPLSNQRSDEYGGSFENRTRYLLEVVQAVREKWPKHKPLFVRLSCSEWSEGGWSVADTLKLAGELVQLGVDLIDCSSGGNSSKQKIPVSPGYQVPFSEAVKKQYQSKILTGAVGAITSGKQAEDILQKGRADLIFLAREHLRNPRFTVTAAEELGVKVSYAPQYQRAGGFSYTKNQAASWHENDSLGGGSEGP